MPIVEIPNVSLLLLTFLFTYCMWLFVAFFSKFFVNPESYFFVC